MSAETSETGEDGSAREAVRVVLRRAMQEQEAAEDVPRKKGVPRGPQGTQGIVVLSNDISCMVFP